jgi:hypothetical protein
MDKYYYFFIGLMIGYFIQNNSVYDIIISYYEYAIFILINIIKYISLLMLIINILNIKCVNDYVENLTDKYIYLYYKIDFE